MGGNYCESLFAILHTLPLLKRGSTLKGKNLLPWETNSLLLKVDSFSEVCVYVCGLGVGGGGGGMGPIWDLSKGSLQLILTQLIPLIGWSCAS